MNFVIMKSHKLSHSDRGPDLDEKQLKYEQAFLKKYGKSSESQNNMVSPQEPKMTPKPRPASACSGALARERVLHSQKKLIEKYSGEARTNVGSQNSSGAELKSNKTAISASQRKYLDAGNQGLNYDECGQLVSSGRRSHKSNVEKKNISSSRHGNTSKLPSPVECSKRRDEVPDNEGESDCPRSIDLVDKESSLDHLGLQLEVDAYVGRERKRSISDLGFTKKHPLLASATSTPRNAMSRTRALLNNPILQKYLARSSLSNQSRRLNSGMKGRLYSSTTSLPVMDDYSPETSPREELEWDAPNMQVSSRETSVEMASSMQRSSKYFGEMRLSQSFSVESLNQSVEVTPDESRLKRGTSLGSKPPVPSLDLSGMSETDESAILSSASLYATPRYVGNRSRFAFPSFGEFRAMRKAGRLTPSPNSVISGSLFFELGAEDTIDEEPSEVSSQDSPHHEHHNRVGDNHEKNDFVEQVDRCSSEADVTECTGTLPEVGQNKLYKHVKYNTGKLKEASLSGLPPSSSDYANQKDSCSLESSSQKCVSSPVVNIHVKHSPHRESFHLVSDKKLLQSEGCKVKELETGPPDVVLGKSQRCKSLGTNEGGFVTKVRQIDIGESVYCDTLRTVPETTFPTSSVTVSRGHGSRTRSESDSKVHVSNAQGHCRNDKDNHQRSKSFGSERNSFEKCSSHSEIHSGLSCDSDTVSTRVSGDYLAQTLPASLLRTTDHSRQYMRPPRAKDPKKPKECLSLSKSCVAPEAEVLNTQGKSRRLGGILQKTNSMGVLYENTGSTPLDRSKSHNSCQDFQHMQESNDEDCAEFEGQGFQLGSDSRSDQATQGVARRQRLLRDRGSDFNISYDGSETTSDLGDEINRSREVSPTYRGLQNSSLGTTEGIPVVRSISDVSDKKAEEMRKKGTRSKRTKVYNSDPFHAVRRETIAEEPPQTPVRKLSIRDRRKLRAARRERRMMGNTKEEILTFLKDAKSGGITDLRTKYPSMHSLRVDYENGLILEDGHSGTEVERVDSGVGSEIKGSTSLADDTLSRCEDCEDHVTPSEDHDTEVFCEVLLCKKCTARRIERKEAIQEVVDTEVSYGNDLRIIKEEFYIPMKTAQLLTSEQLQTIFINLEELITINDHFADQLQDALDLANEQGDEDYASVNIGQLFLESTSMLQAFETYCVNQSGAPLLLEQLEREKELLRVFLQVSQTENSVLRRMNLKSFLMVPVQRVTKYPLLLSRVYRSTPEHNADREAVRQAQEKIGHILEHINSKAKDNMVLKLKRKFSGIRRQNSGNSTENVLELNKLSIEVLGWDRHETNTVMTGRLHCTQPQDHLWSKKTRSMKFTPIYALLLTLGKASQMERTSHLMFPRQTRVRQAALVLYKEKGGKFVLLGEPILLDRCVVYMDPECEELFEVLDTNREVYLFKGSISHETQCWFQCLRLQAKDLGQWRRRRNALPNIMINNMSAKS